MVATEIIAKKRDGGELTREEIEFFVNGFTKGNIPDYQMAAFLMAVYLRGMNFRETADLTLSMMRSGRILDLSHLDKPKVDKHSTGGVGDKISLVLAPLLASLDLIVPMISGRALEHTGGTLDKLESIPGLRTNLSTEELLKVLKEVGVAIIGQSEDIVPADRGMYALRDSTATVSSVPLIASSIMSKKLAEGIDALILDVKVGSGAFMREVDEARELARAMVEIGRIMGKKVRALLTNMDEPLGRAAGNAVEVRESVDVLRGEGPEDVRELTLELASHLLLMVERAEDKNSARKMAEDALLSGRAYEKWERMVRAQGGDPNEVLKDDFTEAKERAEFRAKVNGYIFSFDTRKVGLAVTTLGAGRFRKEDDVDPKAGIIIHRKVGDEVKEGELIFELRTSRSDSLEPALKLLEEAVLIKEERPNKLPLVFEAI